MPLCTIELYKVYLYTLRNKGAKLLRTLCTTEKVLDVKFLYRTKKPKKSIYFKECILKKTYTFNLPQVLKIGIRVKGFKLVHLSQMTAEVFSL